MGLTMMLWPRFVAPYRWELTRHRMAMRNLPAEFEGYRILFVSDLHVGRTRQAYLKTVLQTGMEERPDMVLIGGDLIDYGPWSLGKIEEVLRLLQAKDGVYTVLGNHDYHEYSWRHVGTRSAKRSIHKRLVKAVEASGVRLLRNEMIRIERGSKEGCLQVVGMDEMWAKLADPAKAFAGADERFPIVCVQHNPDGYGFLKDWPWEWLLCGHSHGGQVDVPGLGPLIVPMEHREWLRGFYPFVDSAGRARTMFVSRGVGHTTPLRLRVRPEITLFTLEKVHHGGHGEHGEIQK